MVSSSAALPLALLAVFCLLLGSHGTYAAASASSNNTYNVIATDFTWAENLDLDGAGSLWATDYTRGHLYRITPNGTSYSRTLWISGWKHILGVCVDLGVPSRLVYIVGAVSNGTDAVAVVSTREPNQYKIVAHLPKIGNGLRIHYRTGLLYTSAEGGFLPGSGSVYEVNATSGTYRELRSGMWAADGLWIDQASSMLYVGELFSGKMWRYDIARRQDLGLTDGLKGGLLDDFTLSSDATSILGCSYGAGNIMMWSLNSTAVAPHAVATGITNPTSARFGVGGPGFPATSLFVTEGGGLFASQNDRRVLEFPNFRPAL